MQAHSCYLDALPVVKDPADARRDLHRVTPSAYGYDFIKKSAKVIRNFRRRYAHGLIAKILRTRRWRVTHYGHRFMATSLYLRNHHFPEAYSRFAA